MPHPHEYLLKEFAISIEKLVPLTPGEIIEEAKKLLLELTANEQASERQIRQALIHIGRKEYPYRKAYAELCGQDEEKRLQEAAVGKIDDALKEKLKPMLESGVHITDYANSKLFEEQLAPEERYRVEQAILEAHDVINRQCDERSRERAESYTELVDRWTKEEARVQSLIDQLRSMAERDPKWAGEITGKADQFEEGWSIVERDPSEEEILKEIENWSSVLEGGGEEGEDMVV